MENKPSIKKEEGMSSWDAETLLMKNEPLTFEESKQCAKEMPFMSARRLIADPDAAGFGGFLKLSTAEKNSLAVIIIPQLETVITGAIRDDWQDFNKKGDMMKIVGMAIQAGLSMEEATKAMTLIQNSALK